MKKYLVSLFVIGGLLLTNTTAFAAEPVKGVNFKEYPVQNLTSNSAIVVDRASKKVLFSHNHDLPWTAASLTKIMTGVVFIEQSPVWSKNAKILSEDEVGGGRLRVSPGSLMTVKDIFFSAITGSANNCAVALMRLSGLTNDQFLKVMNFRAWVLGMKNTVFYEPSGMDPRNQTTVDDMAILADYAFGNGWMKKAATTFWYKFNVISPELAKSVKNTNDLLIYDPDLYITGGKTGYLEESQYNLVITTKHMRESRPELIVIVLGADTRQKSFNEAKSLALWMWNNYDW